MIKELQWMECNVPLPNKDPSSGLFAVVKTWLSFYVNTEYLIPEPAIIGDIRLRQVYATDPPMYHSYLTNYKNPVEKRWIGAFSSLQQAKDSIEMAFRYVE